MKVTLLAAFIPLLGTTIDQCQAVLGKAHQCLNQCAHCVLYTKWHNFIIPAFDKSQG